MVNEMGVTVTLHSWTTDIGPEGYHQDITGVNNDDGWFDLMMAALTPVSSSGSCDGCTISVGDFIEAVVTNPTV